MNDYGTVYEELFKRNLHRYSSKRQPIKRRVDRVLTDPYHNTEFLGDVSEKMNLTVEISKNVNSAFAKIYLIKQSCF